jgi:hypothetical protein
MESAATVPVWKLAAFCTTNDPPALTDPVTETLAVCTGALLSDTLSVNVKLPDPVGFPVIVVDAAVPPLSVNPAGSAPALMDQEKGAVPFAAVHVTVYAVPAAAGPTG